MARLAINMEGGFSTDSKAQWDQQNTIVVYPSLEVSLISYFELYKIA